MKILWPLILFFSGLSACSYLPLFETLGVPGVTAVHHRDYVELTPTTGPVHGVGLM